jgi:hypothetical protein
MMPPESQKRTQAASSSPEARGAVYQPVIDGWAVIRPLNREESPHEIWKGRIESAALAQSR